MRQHNKNRNFHLIDVHTVKVPTNTNLSRHMRPRLAPCGKLVYQNGGSRRTPTKWHAKRVLTARTNQEGSYEPVPALHALHGKKK